MKVNGIELLQMIKDGKIKENTKINVFKNDVYITQIDYINNNIQWKPGKFIMSMVYDDTVYFEIPTEIEELEYDHNFYSQIECSLLKNEDAKKAYLLKGINESIDLSLKNTNKINELVREVNCLKRNEQC